MLTLLLQWHKKSHPQPSANYARKRWWDSSMEASEASWGETEASWGETSQASLGETERGKYVCAGKPWKHSPHQIPMKHCMFLSSQKTIHISRRTKMSTLIIFWQINPKNLCHLRFSLLNSGWLLDFICSGEWVPKHIGDVCCSYTICYFT